MSKQSDKPEKVDELTFEQALRELEEIVNRLENEPLSLDESLALFERGQMLGAYCAQLLDKAELKVTSLSTGQTANEL